VPYLDTWRHRQVGREQWTAGGRADAASLDDLSANSILAWTGSSAATVLAIRPNRDRKSHTSILRGCRDWQKIVTRTLLNSNACLFRLCEHVLIVSIEPTCSPFGMADVSTRRELSNMNSLHHIHPLVVALLSWHVSLADRFLQ
jgi:hypothetical protein